MENIIPDAFIFEERMVGMANNYEITYNGDGDIAKVHHIGVNYNGNYYNVIFGKYVNGGFFSIPNWNCGGELAAFSDVFWNKESISRSIKSKRVGEAIAKAIAEYSKGV